jgi:hypothetical protein
MREKSRCDSMSAALQPRQCAMDYWLVNTGQDRNAFLNTQEICGLQSTGCHKSGSEQVYEFKISKSLSCGRISSISADSRLLLRRLRYGRLQLGRI